MVRWLGCSGLMVALVTLVAGCAISVPESTPAPLASQATPVAPDALPVLTLYSYHRSAPYVLDEGQRTGLTFDWATQLNRHLKGWQLRVELIDRTRLDDKLDAGESALILWTRKAFFPHYPALLSSRAIMFDSDVIVGPRNLALHELADLAGKRLCTVAGLYYQPLDEMLKAGELTLVNRDGYAPCIDAVKEGAADAAVVNNSFYLSVHLASDRALVPLRKPITSFSRTILATPDQAEALEALNEAVWAMQRQPEWQATLQRYGAPEFAQLFDLDMQDLLELPVQ